MSSMKGLSLVLATSFMLSFSPGSSFASGGVSVDPDSHTVYVRFSDKGSHDKSGIKIREGAKRGTPGHGGSHHKQSNPHAGKRQPPTSPKLSKSVDRRESDAYIASSILSLASPRIPYLLGLNLSLMEPKPIRLKLSPSRYGILGLANDNIDEAI